MRELPLIPPTIRKEVSSEVFFTAVLTEKQISLLEILLKKNFSDFKLIKERENLVLNGLKPTHYDITLSFKNKEDADFYYNFLVKIYADMAIEEFRSLNN